MGFFDNLSDKITAGSAKVAEKAKEGYEYASLQATIEKEKVAQEKIFLEVGRKFCTECKDELTEKFPELAEKLAESVKKSDEAKEALRSKKGTVSCPGCGKEVAKGTRFCPACGAALPEIEEEAVEEPAEPVAKICPGCGEPVADGAMFCAKCGAKVSE